MLLWKALKGTPSRSPRPACLDSIWPASMPENMISSARPDPLSCAPYAKNAPLYSPLVNPAPLSLARASHTPVRVSLPRARARTAADVITIGYMDATYVSRGSSQKSSYVLEAGPGMR